MRFRDWATRVILIFLMLTALILVLFIGGAKKPQNNTGISNPNSIFRNQHTQGSYQAEERVYIPRINLPKLPILSQPSVESNQKNQVITQYITTAAFAKYKPNLAAAQVHPSNYGERFTHDVNGIPVNNQPIIVLHETTNSASSAVNFFQTNNVDENVQASYHALITLDGTVIYLVPPDKRAFGASNSVFKG
ncbi:MAG: N-acetylmuramoyl-L-alanine amidase, partial [Nostocales cyanobacterium]